MPQALSAVYIHLVFSTKERRPWLRDLPTREALHAFMGGASKQLDCPPILVGGVEDHVHLLARFGRMINAGGLGERTKTGFQWLAKGTRPGLCRL